MAKIISHEECDYVGECYMATTTKPSNLSSVIRKIYVLKCYMKDLLPNNPNPVGKRSASVADMFPEYTELELTIAGKTKCVTCRLHMKSDYDNARFNVLLSYCTEEMANKLRSYRYIYNSAVPLIFETQLEDHKNAIFVVFTDVPRKFKI